MPVSELDEWLSQARAGRVGPPSIRPVDSFKPNPWGLYNVHGNVWDWTEDCWNESNTGNPGDGSARSTGDCTFRVVRGGWYSGLPHLLRAAHRGKSNNGRLNLANSFRVARTLHP